MESLEKDKILNALDNFQDLNLDINPENFEESDLMKVFGTFLELPDEQFDAIAPYIITELQTSLRDPETQLALLHQFKESGHDLDELLESAASINEALEGLNDELELSKNKIDFIKQITLSVYNSLSASANATDTIVNIPIELCHEDAQIPTYANLTDAGMDIYALEDIVIKPGEIKLVPTGLKVAIPIGYELQIRPKSGRALKTKLRIANTPGTIDSGYRDEIKVIIENIEPSFKDIGYHFDDNGKIIIDSIEHGSNMYITKGEKFAQLVLNKIPKASFYKVNSVMEFPNDGRAGGFGSTGIK